MNAKVIGADRVARVGGQFGKKPKGKNVWGDPAKLAVGYLGAGVGAGAGLAVGSVPGHKQRKQNIKEIRSNRGKMASNTRKIRTYSEQQVFGKGAMLKSPRKSVGPFLITDVGTKAGKVRYNRPAPPRQRLFSRGTYIAGGTTAAGGAALTVGVPHKAGKDQKKEIVSQQTRLKAQQEKMASVGIGKSAFFEVEKKRPGIKLIPKVEGVGRGQYVHAPRLRDKARQPKWVANALVNNPSNAAAGAAVVGGAVLLKDQRVKKSKDREKNVVGGAMVGAGAGQLARVGADYGSKTVGERQFKPLTTKGNYGPYVEGPHKPVLNKYKRVANKAGGGNVRAKAKFFDENFPKGVPSYNARKVGVLLNRRGAIAGAAAGGAALGAGVGVSHKVKKNYSAFGVEHG